MPGHDGDGSPRQRGAVAGRRVHGNARVVRRPWMTIGTIRLRAGMRDRGKIGSIGFGVGVSVSVTVSGRIVIFGFGESVMIGGIILIFTVVISVTTRWLTVFGQSAHAS